MYLLIKTSQDAINKRGSLFEAVRGHWRLDPVHASLCSHVIVALTGSKDIKAVYTMDKWYKSTVDSDRYVFAGEVDEEMEHKLVGKTLNPKYTNKGMENPILYIAEEDLLEV